MTVRDAVREFARLGPLPAEDDSSEDAERKIDEAERGLLAITRPVTDDEAALLVRCFGPDNCFGLAWTLLHLVETAPSLPVSSPPPEDANPWLRRLWRRYLTTQPEH